MEVAGRGDTILEFMKRTNRVFDLEILHRRLAATRALAVHHLRPEEKQKKSESGKGGEQRFSTERSSSWSVNSPFFHTLFARREGQAAHIRRQIGIDQRTDVMDHARCLGLAEANGPRAE